MGILMLYDANNRAIPETAPAPPAAGSALTWEPGDRADTDVSRALTPVLVDRILTSANGGDTAEQCRLAAEVEEKSWDIAQALQTRRMAVAGLEWELLPPQGDESAKARSIAEAAEEMLRSPRWDAEDELDTFQQALFFELMGALLPGFAVVEMVWSAGGAELLGFEAVEQRHFTYRESRSPLLVTRDRPNGMALEAAKFCVHYHRARPGARCRGGLIRPLAWLHCFANLNTKDLLTFIERYGMPFLIARVGQEAWEKDRNRIKYLIQNFGPAGGAVFSAAVQTELMQASTSTGDVYFKLLEYLGDAVTKVVLGQTATSGDSAGLSGGDAQSAVRQDLLEGDARALENTSRTRILRLWTMWNYGPDAPVPRLHLMCEPPEDTQATAETAKTLYEAGLEWDEAEASERFGMKLTRLAAPASAEAPTSAKSAKGATPPRGALSAEVSASAESPMDAGEDAAAVALSRLLRGNGLSEWFGPLQSRLNALADIADDGAFREAAVAMVADLPALTDEMDSTQFETLLEQLTYAQVAEGKAAKAAALAERERTTT